MRQVNTWTNVDLSPNVFSGIQLRAILQTLIHLTHNIQDGKIHGANMGPTWVLSAPDGPHVGPMNLAMRDVLQDYTWSQWVNDTPFLFQVRHTV